MCNHVLAFFWFAIIETCVNGILVFSPALCLLIIPYYSDCKPKAYFRCHTVVGLDSAAFLSPKTENVFNVGFDSLQMIHGNGPSFLSAAIGQRPRNYLSCCCCCSCSTFGSFPHYKKFQRKKISPAGICTWDLQIHSPALIHWAKVKLLLLCMKIIYLFQKSRRRPWTSIGWHLLFLLF